VSRVLALIAAGLFQVAAAVPADSVWRRDHDVPVPMRDGVVLRADVFRPKSGGPFPVLVYRTPYDKNEAVTDHQTVRHAVERGYAVVLQDVRGRYASDGTFDAYHQEGPDGYDTIEWAARQPWSNGNVGTFGLSYPGAVQWLAAIESPPHLKAMVPMMTFASPRQFFYSGGAWDLSWAPWVWYNIAPDLRVKAGVKTGDRSYAEARKSWPRESKRVSTQRPLLDLPDFKGIAPWYYDWIRRGPADPWWDFAELRTRYGKVGAAVLNVSGWYDESYGPVGAVTNYTGLVASRPASDPRTRLIVGPWQHGVSATETPKAGARSFSADARIDHDKTLLDWMDRWVKGVENGVMREPAVRVYVMGANRWRTGDRWPLPGIAAETLYFGALRDLTRQVQPSTRAVSTSYVSDPAHPVVDPYDGDYGAHDYRALKDRADVLTFDTEPLTEDVEVIGAMQAEVFFQTDARDVDLHVKVLDVAPDGTALNLMAPGREVKRASYRDISKRQLLEPGQTYALTWDELFTANRFAKGHRIRVQVMSSFLPHYSVNPQTGESEATSAAVQQARVTILHDGTHPSRIVLPVMRAP
jgi:putative CocE/NonD family hydrolase